MLVDGLKLIEGGAVENLVIPKGTAFPTPPDYGELFYRTDQDILYFYENTTSTWVAMVRGVDASKWTDVAGDIYRNTGNVAIGATDPLGDKLRVVGTSKFEGAMDLGANKITSSAIATANNDVTNKLYVDNATAFHAQLAYSSANQSVLDATPTEVEFNGETYDTDNIHDPVTNNTQFVVPTGKDKVRLSFKVTFEGNSSGTRVVEITKNASSTYVGYVKLEQNGDLNGNVFYITTPILHVNAGDIFRVVATQDSGVSLNIVGSGTGETTWGGMEVLN